MFNLTDPLLHLISRAEALISRLETALPHGLLAPDWAASTAFRYRKRGSSCALEPVKHVARSLKAHLSGIVTYLKHGFCNAFAEGVNSRIQLLVQKACGYRNRERLKTDILFHFGGLTLNPVLDQ